MILKAYYLGRLNLGNVKVTPRFNKVTLERHLKEQNIFTNCTNCLCVCVV